MLISLLLSVIFQIAFVYFANFLGQKVIKDLRIKIFNRIIEFKLDYFKKNNTIYEKTPNLYIMKDKNSLDIDNHSDLKKLYK